MCLMLFDIVLCLAFVSSSPPEFLKAWKGKLLTTLYVANNSVSPQNKQTPQIRARFNFFQEDVTIIFKDYRQTS